MNGFEFERLISNMLNNIYPKSEFSYQELLDVANLIIPEYVKHWESEYKRKKSRDVRWEFYGPAYILDHLYKIDYTFKCANKVFGVQVTSNEAESMAKLDEITMYHNRGLYKRAGINSVCLVLGISEFQLVDDGFISRMHDEEFNYLEEQIFDLVDLLIDTENSKPQIFKFKLPQ